jgi:hypothetical protein
MTFKKKKISKDQKDATNSSIHKQFTATKIFTFACGMKQEQNKNEPYDVQQLKIVFLKMPLYFYIIQKFHIFHVSSRIFPSGPDDSKRHDVHRIERHR